MKKIIVSVVFMFVFMVSFTFAQDGQAAFEIIPSSTSDVWNKVNQVAQWGKVRENYKNISQSNTLWLWEQFASGIMNWDTIIDYVAYLAKFLGQLALLAWAVCFIIFWYKKATEHLKWSWSNLGKIITWLLVVIFSYVIIRIIRSMFLS